MQKFEKIFGDDVTLCRLNNDNREQYLQVYRVASTFSDLYMDSDKLWRTTCDTIGTDSDTTTRYLIYVRDTKEACGFINYDMEDDMPSIDIAIAPNYRYQGYGYQAAETLCKYLLSEGQYHAILWHAMARNTASIRIAEKLGGELIEGKDIFGEALSKIFGKDAFDYKHLPATRSYLIKQIKE